MDYKKKVVGIVLAAGMSTRMGQFKQLLPIGDKTVVLRVVEVMLVRLQRVVVVVGHRANEVRDALAGCGVECVENELYRDGMLSSVQCAVRTIGTESDYAICLGDQPSLKVEVLDAVLNASVTSGKGIVIPQYRGRGGHPVFLHRRYGPQILALGEEVGLNIITRGFPADTHIVDLDIPEILHDMDTPEDYRRELGRFKKDGN